MAAKIFPLFLEPGSWSLPLHLETLPVFRRLNMVFIDEPKEADILLVLGPVSEAASSFLTTVFEAIPAPKFVIAPSGAPCLKDAALPDGRTRTEELLEALSAFRARGSYG